MGQVATVFLQVPHKHASFDPTRPTTGVTDESVVYASATPTISTMSASWRALPLDRYMLPRHADNLGSGVGQLHLRRNQAHERSDKQHPVSDPDARNQRENV